MITVLRIGHRAGRDPRIATHCALTARALGAGKLLYTGEHDSDMEDSVRKISAHWGGPFSISYEKSWRGVIKGFKGETVHLTMYGMPLARKMPAIRKAKDVLLIIGGEKVPSEVYHIVGHNVAVGSQPHSEVAALAVFLHEYFGGKELQKSFPGGKINVVPQEKGKKTVTE
ncbi:MAG: tRNA (cytidine(56)-2'-O)-methyltransferase [Candidatus Aenigmatarchaeota archaeon]